MTDITQRQLIFLLSSIGLIALPHVMQVPVTLFGFFAFLWTWRFIGIWQKNWLPNNIMIFLLMLSGIALLILEYRGVVFGRNAGTGLFIVALGLKLLEIKTTRDVYLIVYLAFVVAATQFLYVQNMLMAVYILAVCSVLLCTLIAINSTFSHVRTSFKMAGIIILQALPIMIALFVLFPRLEPPRWSLLQEEHKSLSGLSDTLELDKMSKLALSYDLAFRVKFEGDIPPPNQRYWRGVVFSKTDGNKWFQSDNVYFGRFMDEPKFSGKAYRYTVMMEPQNKNWVFGLEMPAEFLQPLSRNVNYQLITSHNPSERAEYKIASYPNYNTGYITRTEYKDNLQLPDVIPARVLELAERLKNDSPEIFIENVLGYFRNENFSYTLSPPTMSENPIETFLFDEKKGFCSHYAAAFVYLMRVREIPARIVGGYQGGELNQVGNFLEIRQANAHAWAEVWLKSKGWVRVDPTTAILPERVEQNVNVAEQIETGEVNFDPITIESQEQLNWLRTARYLWENVDYSWQRWVINYNNQNQAKFLKTMGIHNLQAMMYWLLYCIALIVTLSAWFLLKNKYQETDEAFIIYQKFCRKLEKNGLIRKPAEGFKDFAQRCSNEMPNVSTQISEVTGLFLQFRYEKNCSTPENLKKLRKTANQKISQKSEDY